VSLELRQARPDETALVSSVLAEAAAWLEARGETLWQQDELATEAIAADVARGFYYLAYAGNAAVGVLRLTPDDQLFWPEMPAREALYLHRLAVRRAAAGGETSRGMLTWAANEARRLGCAYLRLDCVASRTKLRALYERFGFRYHSDRQVGPYLVARYELVL
jgi:hypothetical protein